MRIVKTLFRNQINLNYSAKETYHKLFVERWSFTTGAVLLTLMFVFIINSTGSSWGLLGPMHYGAYGF